MLSKSHKLKQKWRRRRRKKLRLCNKALTAPSIFLTVCMTTEQVSERTFVYASQPSNEIEEKSKTVSKTSNTISLIMRVVV